MRERHCPVCKQRVGKPTIKFNVRNHFDSIGRDECPGSGLPYDVAVDGGADEWERSRREAVSSRISAKKLEHLEERLARPA